MTNVDNFLAHYGVKGMKWGVRKRSSDSTPKPKKPKKVLTPAQKKARRDMVNTLLIGASYATILATPKIMNAVEAAGERKLAAAGAKRAADMLSDSRGLTSYKTISLAFDAVRDTWS